MLVDGKGKSMKRKLKSLNELRKQNGYSYSNLGKKVGYSKTYTWQLINGQRNLSYEQAILMAAIFNMKPDEVFYNDFSKKI